MVAAVSGDTSQEGQIVLLGGAAANANMSQLQAITMYSTPADQGAFSQLQGIVLAQGPDPLTLVSQWQAIVLYGGRVDQPSLTAWTFTLDGHDFYVLRLGDDVSFVYDQNTQQWSEFGDDLVIADGSLNKEGRWLISTGLNWPGMGALSYQMGSDIVAGDDTFGILYAFDPEYDQDYNPSTTTVKSFHRMAQGQLVMTSRDVIPVWGVQLSGSVGEQWTGDYVNVELSSSDDMGNTYFSHGITTVPQGSFNFRLDWNSLGSMSNPGRLFKVEDDGALVRIDALDSYDKDQ